MITVTNDYKQAALANYRDPRARVRITWTNTVTDSTLESSSTDINRVSYLNQVTDGVITVPYKWAHCSTGLGTGELIADGSFHPMPDGEENGQVGWYNDTASNVSGEWVTDPKLTQEFVAKSFRNGIVTIYCDDKYNQYPIDFKIYMYAGVVLKYTKVVTGNTLTVIPVTMPDIADINNITKIVLEVNKWSAAYHLVKIIEINHEKTDVYYDDDIISLEILEEMETNEGSLPIGNISCNEINLTLLNEDNKFSFGNTNSIYNNFLKKERKIDIWLGFVLPSGSTDVSSGTYIVETINGKKVGFHPYGVYWSDEWVSDMQTISVKTFARDRMDQLRRFLFDDSGLYENVTLYALANFVMISFNNKTLDTVTWEIDSSLLSITIPYGYFQNKSYFEALRDIAIAGSTTVYVDRTGKVIIGKIPVEPGSSPSEATWTQSEYFNVSISPKIEEIANTIIVRAKALSLAGSPSIIYTSTETYTIPVSGSLILTLLWNTVPVDPDTISTTIIPIMGAPYIINEQYFSSTGVITVFGVSGQTFQVQSQGVVLLPQSELEYKANDVLSEKEYGVRRYLLGENHLIQSYNIAEQIGSAILPKYKNLRKDASVSIPANTIVEISDPILLTEYKDFVLETNSYFYIIRQNIIYNGALDSTVELRRFTS